MYVCRVLRSLNNFKRFHNTYNNMKAVVVDQFGGPEVLGVKIVDIPKPGPRQFLVKVHAAGVNPVETYKRSGGYAYVHHSALLTLTVLLPNYLGPQALTEVVLLRKLGKVLPSFL
jgi:hypothetical protein